MPKISALPAAAAANLTDLLAKVNDPSGVPVTQKVTIAQLKVLLDTIYLSLSGGTVTGIVAFTGAANPGLKLNVLTTAQRNALVADEGMVIYNVDTLTLEYFENSGPSWKTLVTTSAATQVLLYNGASPTADGIVPPNPDLPALAYKRDGSGPIYGWNTLTLAWN